MAWHRKVPFGYQMRMGRVEPHPQEAETVRYIVTQYLSGASLQSIADHLTKFGPRYHQDTPVWNKNMVKRILENRKYTGCDGYPQLISEEDYRSVNRTKAERNVYAPVPERVWRIRPKLVCACCGAPMERKPKSRDRQRWKCRDATCGKSICVSDVVLTELVRNGLGRLEQEPQALDLRSMEWEPALSKDAVRLQNELNLALNRGTESIPYIRALIFAGAAERYASLPDPTPMEALGHLKEKLKQKNDSEDAMWELFNSAVKAIRVMPGPSIEFVLINGRTYCTSNTTEEGKT